MAKKTPEEEVLETSTATIEALAQKYRVPNAFISGVCVAQGWRPGKQVTHAEFEKALASFKKSKIGGGSKC